MGRVQFVKYIIILPKAKKKKSFVTPQNVNNDFLHLVVKQFTMTRTSSTQYRRGKILYNINICDSVLFEQ